LDGTRCCHYALKVERGNEWRLFRSLCVDAEHRLLGHGYSFNRWVIYSGSTEASQIIICCLEGAGQKRERWTESETNDACESRRRVYENKEKCNKIDFGLCKYI